MDLLDSINRRKSCRNYTQQPFEEKRLEEIRGAINRFEPLYPDVPPGHRLITKVKGILKVQAPHYLMISGQGKEEESENTGFLFQQLILWFDAHDIGSVWLGKTKNMENADSKDIIIIAFGQANEPVHRSKDEFKRKPISEIIDAPENTCIRAVHLAPSGMSIQPWYLEESDDRVLFYKQSLKSPLSSVYRKAEVDTSIMLCHYALARRHFDRPFILYHKEEGTNKKGYRLFGELV